MKSILNFLGKKVLIFLLVLAVSLFSITACDMSKLEGLMPDTPSDSTANGDGDENNPDENNPDENNPDENNPNENKFTVSFDLGGGTGSIEDQTVNRGDKAIRPQDPERAGFTFLGWYFGDEVWSFEDGTVSGNMTLTAKWYEHFTEGLCFTLLDDDTYSVSIGDASAPYIVIPSTYNGKAVTLIPKYAFMDAYNLESISIPGSVLNIDDYAFSQCSNLINVSLGEGIVRIGESAFEYCESIRTITIPDSVKTIEGQAFIKCFGLESVVMGQGVEFIGYSAFNGCEGLTAFEIPDSVKEIGNNAFNGCKNITGIKIGRGLSTIAGGAFYACNILVIRNESEFNFEAGSEENGHIAENAKIVINQGETSTADDGYPYFLTDDGFLFKLYNNTHYHLIAYIDGERSVTVPTDFEGNPYSIIGMRGVREVIVPDGYQHYLSRSFENCTTLESIIIGDGVTYIGNTTFKNCTNLTKVSIGKSVKRIEDEAFLGCSSLESLYLPDSVTHIGKKAFYECEELWDLRISQRLTYIGENAFYYCKRLSRLVIPDSVTTICDYAFRSCIGVSAISIGSGVTSIGKDAFYGFDNLCLVLNNSSISAEIGSTEAGSLAYYAKILIDKDGSVSYADDGLEYIVTDEGFIFSFDSEKYTLISYIGSEKTVTLPKSINGADYDIYHMNGIVHLIIPEGFTSIDEEAFWNCMTIKSVVIADSVTTISDEAFNSCSGLDSIILGSGVTYVGRDAFHVTTNTARVYYKGTYQNWTSLDMHPLGNDLLWYENMLYFYSENPPESNGRYWHYGADGSVTVWE